MFDETMRGAAGNSRLLQCPLPANFFAKMGKRHSSEIRRELMKLWRYDRRQMKKVLRSRLCQFGVFNMAVASVNANWEDALHFADDWNRYHGVLKDKQFLQEKFDKKEWGAIKYSITLDMPTYLTLASLAFLVDAEKESPNHLFLKELMILYLHRSCCTGIQDEYTFTAIGETVRSDLKAEVADSRKMLFASLSPNELIHGNVVIVEVGGMQLWKILLYMRLGYVLMVAPHWTKQKINPFIRKRLQYDVIVFMNKS